jgi:hypothetical protein
MHDQDGDRVRVEMRLPVERIPIGALDLFSNPPMHLMKKAADRVRRGPC